MAARITSDRIIEAVRAGCTTKQRLRKRLSISESACHRVVNDMVWRGLIMQVVPDKGAVPAVFALPEQRR